MINYGIGLEKLFPNDDPYIGFGKIILQNTNKFNFNILTFNYDLGLENSLLLNDIHYSNCLDQNSTNTYDLRLLKLHGSINWLRTKDEHLSERIIEIPVKFYLEAINSDEIKQNGGTDRFQELVLKYRKEENLKIGCPDEPFIVPPTWNKHNHYSSLKYIWKNAAQLLSEADYIFVIGYSLPITDQFFKFLYALGSIGRSQFRKFIVINPEKNPEKVDNKFRELLGSGALQVYKYEPITFSESIKKGILNSLLET